MDINKEYRPLPQPFKGVYPFRLACPSFIYPDNIIPNVRMLGPFVDEIELVLFESIYPGSLPSREDIKSLADLAEEFDITYNVHLPTDVSFTDLEPAGRATAVETVIRVVDLCAGLNPSTHTLHLPFNMPSGTLENRKAWEEMVCESCELLLQSEIDARSVSLETLDYPFEWADDVIRRFDFSVCLDLGHLIFHGFDTAAAYEKYRDRTTIIHLHGVEKGRDHLALSCLSNEEMSPVAHILQDYNGSLSLEVFSHEKLSRSLKFLWDNRDSASTER